MDTGYRALGARDICSAESYAKDDGTVGGTSKMRFDGTTLFITTSGTDA